MNKDAKIEVPIMRSGITHRADAVLWNGEGNIIELQHSAITPDEIEARERFYGNKMIWIFDVREAYKEKRFVFRKKDGDKHTFRWKQPRKSIAFAKRPVFLDLGEGYMFQLAKLFPDAPCGGFGKLHLSFRVQSETMIDQGS
jgi:competence protein CoiA